LNSFIAAVNSQKQVVNNSTNSATKQSINPNALNTLSKNNVSYISGLNMSVANSSNSNNNFSTNINNNNISYFNGSSNNSSGNESNRTCQFRNPSQLDQRSCYELMNNSSNSNTNKSINTNNTDTRYNLDRTQASSKVHQSQPATTQFNQNSNCQHYQQHSHHQLYPDQQQYQQYDNRNNEYLGSNRSTHADLIKGINSHLNISCNSGNKQKSSTPPSPIYSPKLPTNYASSSSLYMLHTAAMGICSPNSSSNCHVQPVNVSMATNEAAVSMLKLSNSSLNNAMEISAPSSLVNASNANVFINTHNSNKQKPQASIINTKNNDGLLFKLINKIYNAPTLIKK
jgi:hypothetical protein